MDVVSRITSKGQVTIPKLVRDALKLKEGDRVVFRVVGERAELARTADLLELAGAVPVSAPAAEVSMGWDEVRRQLRRARARQKS
ncbi:MAG: AbrB/MazE/SpoVT family DNA-binding domain-containing protein [Gaiellaceae bacterium]|jgi:AbrB family looped-hinge helix DNA binding protein